MRGWVVFLTAAVAMLVLSAGMAQPQASEPVLDANVPDGDAWDDRFFSGQTRLAQTFVAQNSGRLAEARFRVRPYSPNTTNLTAEIVTPPSRGNPAKSLSKATVSASAMTYGTENGGMVTASFVNSATPPVDLVAGREYALRLSAPAPGAYWIEQYSYPNTVYPAGKLCDASDDLAWATCFSSDGVFAVYVLPNSTTDSTPPTITTRMPSSPLTPGWNSTDFDVNFTALDNVGGTGVESITYSAEGAQKVLPTTVSGSQASVRITEEGDTVLTYSARDQAGNTSPEQKRTVRLDKTEPYTTVESGPDGPTPSFAFGGTDNLAPQEDIRYSYRLDDGGWSSFSAQTMAILGGEVGLADGSHTLYLRVRDLAGNVGGSLPQSFVVDTVAPDTKILSGPPGFTRSRTAVFDVAMSETGNAECRLDGAR